MQRTSAPLPNERSSLQGMRGVACGYPSVPLSNRLESLRGDRRGQQSIRLNDPYRICYRLEEGYVDDEGHRQTPSVRRNAAARSSVFAIIDASLPAAPTAADDVVSAWWVTAIG